MSPAGRIVLAVTLLSTITLAGAVGFMLVEGWSWVDALYMSVITLSTVGYGEPHQLSRAGRLFTSFYIVTGVGAALYLLSMVAEVFIEGRLRALFARRFQIRRISRMENHVIVAGYGRFGRAVVRELLAESCPLVVIERDAMHEQELVSDGVPYLLGSAAADEVLENAGIRQAMALVVATGSEAENVFITLAARELGSGVRIQARADTESGTRRLERAGADQVIAPFQMGGMRAAASILRPAVVDFVELATPRRGEEVDLEEIRVQLGSTLVGCEIGALEGGAGPHRVVALKREPGPIRLTLSGREIIEAGDHLVVIGPRSDLQSLAQQAQAPSE